MTPERWQRIKEVFNAALERGDGEARRALLDEACGDDSELRAEVESLIAAHESDAEFLSAPAAQMAARMMLADDGGSSLEAGQTVGSYRIVSTLGEGGMGKVYLAQDTLLGRKVALKLLPASFTTDAERVQRFEQEARAASALNHPNILTIYEIGADGPLRFIATEFVEGETLRERLQQGPRPASEVLDLGIQTAAALAAAHAARVVHRDVKPENLMVRPDGYVKVLDFGLAKPKGDGGDGGVTSDSDSLARALVNTRPGMVMGTCGYMSPEQTRGLEVDERTDIWSLGVVLYEMTAGRAPFDGPTASDVMAAVLQRDPVPLAQASADVPAELERIVMKALAKDREERYQTVKDLGIDLRRLKQRVEFETELRRARGREGDASGERMGASAFAPSRMRESDASSREARAPSRLSGEQLKQVTVLFADFYGLSALTETLDAEEVSEVMRGLWNRVDAAVMDFGGTVDRHMGNEVMALWGALRASEDDPEHAVRAALRMQREVAEFIREHLGEEEHGEGQRAVPERDAAPLMRVGINTGAVLLSADGARGELTATGAAVNVAHRLEQAAPVGAILISHDTYRHVRGIFDVREMELPGAKGRAEPVRTYSVERAKPRAFRVRTRGVEGVETRMVGREAELARMRDALETVVEDRELQAVTVIGDAGLGKSRLLYEFSNEVELLPHRVSIFQGRASQWTRGLPYSLVRDLFSSRFGVQESDAADVARAKMERGMAELFGASEESLTRAHFVGHLIGLDFSASPYLAGILDDVKQVRGRAFHYAAQFFREVARAAPAVVYLDDLHWADDGSLDFVAQLARDCADAPLLILGFARTDLLERRPAWGEGLANHARLTLQPLTRRESRQLVEEILRNAQSIPHALRELVVSAAEGNPFYVEELIKMLIDQRVILPSADRWRVDASRLVEVRVPQTLTGVLQARLDVLTPWERVVLQRASVIGREFWEDALEQFSRASSERGQGDEEGDTAEALEVLRRRELVYRRESSAFTGTREYIFKHAILRGVAYENVLKRERRRLHGETARWLIARSGGRVEEYAAVIAEHYERARDAARAMEWYGRAGAQARASYAPEAAIGFYRKALEFLSDAEAKGDGRASEAAAIKWCGGLGEVLTMQARYGEAVEAFARMLERAEAAGDVVAQARAWNGLTAVQEYRGDNRAALESARRAEGLARAGGDDAAAKAEEAVALNRHGLASHRLGDAASVEGLGRRLLDLSDTMAEGRRHARANGLRLLGVAHETQGRFKEAEECFAQSLDLLRQSGDRRNIGFMLNNLGVISHLQGDYERAVERYTEALSIFREVGERTCELPGLGNLAGAQIGLEEYAAAESNLREAVTLAGEGAHFALSMIYCYLAESFRGQGKVEEARETALVALSLGQRAENQDYIASAWRALGLVASGLGRASVTVEGRDYTARECFAESLRVFTLMGAEAERARTLRDWARSELRRGDAERGREMLTEAREIFARLGMRRELERTEPAAHSA
ncbi:MAG TPA: protein kinase [Pyrinomonadaceae bacterium]|nr:protein kinase [Pyrinomonadaceae bacterium]